MKIEKKSDPNYATDEPDNNYDRFLHERITIAKHYGCRLSQVEVDDMTFGGEPVVFVRGKYSGYLGCNTVLDEEKEDGSSSSSS